MSKIEEIKKRTEINASMSSDDFCHDTQALLEFESKALQIAADDIQTLLTHIDSLEQKLAKAKSALEFYAKEQIYRMDSEGISTATEIECDEGFLARTTLAEIGEK